MKKASSKEISGLRKSGFVVVKKTPKPVDPLMVAVRDIVEKTVSSNEKLITSSMEESRSQGKLIVSEIVDTLKNAKRKNWDLTPIRNKQGIIVKIELREVDLKGENH